VAAKPKTIDEYLAGVPADRRRALSALRAMIHAALPGVEECISYAMPAFRHEGRVVAGFLSTSTGCSYFPFSGTTLATLAGDLGAYSQTKSPLHFEPARPLSKTVVKKLLKARIAELSARATPSGTRSVRRAVPPLGRAKPAKRASRKARSRSS
jgi:uncharacterized protein YdhG (YjbR/CyaY superfamily)